MAEATVRIVPGSDLLVLRSGRVIAVVEGESPEAAAQHCEALLEAATATETGAAVAAALDRADPTVRGAALVLGGLAWEIVLRGDIDVVARTPLGTMQLNGREAQGAVRQPLFGSVTEVRLGGSSGQALAGSQLGAGVVPAGGAVVLPDASSGAGAPMPVAASDSTPADHDDAVVDLPVRTHTSEDSETDSMAAEPGEDEDPATVAAPTVPPAEPASSLSGTATPPAPAEGPPTPPTPPSEPPEPPEADLDAPATEFESLQLVGGPGVIDLAQLQRPRTPLPLAAEEPVAAADPRGAADDPDAVVLDGLNCARGHFNHPHAANCAWCGLGMAQVSHVLVRGKRPPLGVLVIDEQATFTLDADYIVGRQPSKDPSIDGVRVRELVLADAERQVSRVHATVRLQGWDVVVEDQGSGNGTYVVDPATGAPALQLPPHTPRVLGPGEHVHIGRHRLTFHSHHLRPVERP